MTRLSRLPAEEYSVSELRALAGCLDRHHYEYVLRMPTGIDLEGREWTADHLTPQLRGSIIHELLGNLPSVGEAALRNRVRETLEREAMAAGRRIRDSRYLESAADSIVRQLESFRASPLFRRVSAAIEVQREVPFVYGMRPTLRLAGTIDLAFRESDGWRVLEFKTSDDITVSPEIAATPHEFQCALYSSALQAAVWPERVREASVFFTDSGRDHNWAINLDYLGSWERRAEELVDRSRRYRFVDQPPLWEPAKCGECPFLSVCGPRNRPSEDAQHGY